jgi:hypothetical protein
VPQINKRDRASEHEHDNEIKDGRVLCTRVNVGDCGQSVVQFGGDDRSCICLGTDMAVFVYYFCILILLCTLLLSYNRYLL